MTINQLVEDFDIATDSSTVGVTVLTYCWVSVRVNYIVFKMEINGSIGIRFSGGITFLVAIA